MSTRAGSRPGLCRRSARGLGGQRAEDLLDGVAVDDDAGAVRRSRRARRWRGATARRRGRGRRGRRRPPGTLADARRRRGPSTRPMALVSCAGVGGSGSASSSASSVAGPTGMRRSRPAWLSTRRRRPDVDVEALGEACGDPAADRVVAAGEEPGVVGVQALDALAGAADAAGRRRVRRPRRARRRARRRSGGGRRRAPPDRPRPRPAARRRRPPAGSPRAPRSGRPASSASASACRRRAAGRCG